MTAAGLTGPPKSLAAYLTFVDAQLAKCTSRGAVAMKFDDAYHRTRLFREVLRPRAEAIYARGLAAPRRLALRAPRPSHVSRTCGAAH